MNLTAYNFTTSLSVRAVMRDGEPWFVAADVCAALEIANPSDALRRLDGDERTLDSIEGASNGLPVNLINESGLYSLIMGSRKPEAKRFKRWVTSEVLPSIRKTGSYSTRPAAQSVPQSVEAVLFAEAVNRALRLEGSAALGMVRSAVALKAPEYLPLLPVYAIDAPAGAPAVSSAPTESLTSLMARYRVGVSTRAGNLILQERGLLEERTRPYSAGGIKSFWSVTEEGREYGKNVVHPENPRETQPHWFSAKGEELLRVMGVLE